MYVCKENINNIHMIHKIFIAPVLNSQHNPNSLSLHSFFFHSGNIFYSLLTTCFALFSVKKKTNKVLALLVLKL